MCVFCHHCPGLGILLAYCFFCKDDTTRQSAPGAVIIHLLGGIHEIYFPYILMNPVIIIAPIVGNFCAILFYSMTGAGLSGPASPGSLIAYMAMAPRDSILTVLLGVVIAGAVSFVLSSVILKATSGHAKSLTDAQNEMKEMKAQAKGEIPEPTAVNVGQIRKIVFACDAGMGSSAMGATKFHNRIKAERPDLTVTKNGKAADMKKIFAVMGLAVKCGETVTIAADGPDEDAAIEELTKLCKDA